MKTQEVQEKLAVLDTALSSVREIVGPVVLVGGCVRDALLGKTSHDFDFASPLSPDEIEDAIRRYGRKPYLAGKRYGTIGFKFQGQIIEITSFRSEHYPEPGRHPLVNFDTDLQGDLGRRDFTINALAYDGSLHDPFGGLDDLEAGVIRGVGINEDRIQEDPLRMLRAARFAAQLGFRVSDDYIQSALSLRDSLFCVSKERWISELDKLLCSVFIQQGIHVLAQTGLLSLIFSEFASYEDSDDIGSVRLSRALFKVPPIPTERWAVLFAHMAEAPLAFRFKDAPLHTQRALSQELVKKYGPYLKFSRARELEITARLQEDWDFYNSLRS
ncbi:MAG: CCA tRNA nucleotidyltransferase [Coriobacteriia bacterium]|nr:CCA tRNA nucleotidyltransferase [Coriobacteriia bacterium]